MLSPALASDDLSVQFLRERRVIVKNILESVAAEAVWNCLTRDVPWDLVFRRGADVITLDEKALSSLDATTMAQITAGINAQAQHDFQFVYWKFSMVDAYRRKLLPDLLLHRVLEALANPQMISFVRQVTGLADIARVDAQATLYRPGNFLTSHNDEEDGKNRRAAYVIQLCRRWKTEWGGLLQFLGDDGSVIDTFTPGFNQMSLFAVPQLHAVSMVTPFAGEPRFAITGWFTA